MQLKLFKRHWNRGYSGMVRRECAQVGLNLTGLDHFGTNVGLQSKQVTLRMV